jgi:DNA (cytosine-5)-methyltransferase 1
MEDRTNRYSREGRVNVLDLFSGIGGFSLGLERAGMRTVAFCEIDPFCRKVLAKHWPSVPCYDDIRTLTADRLVADGIAIDAICGGFPCQDISEAGEMRGIEGARSGLWSEYARIIGELRPRVVIVENVAALLGNGMGRVLGDLAALRYDAEWHCIPASAIGAPHARDRVWIVAHAPEARLQGGIAERLHLHSCEDWEVSERDILRGPDGFPDWPHRIAGLGNSVVPQIPEIIGRAIMIASGWKIVPTIQTESIT